MSTLIVYGSLMHRDALVRVGLDPANARPVVVRGYRRSFDQEPTWRLRETGDRAVLAVRESAEASFNAILVTGIVETAWEALDERERGYVRTEVPASMVTPFDPSSPLERTSASLSIYLGKPGRRNEELLPNPAYLRTCMEGAGQWGAAFREAFLQSTFVAHRTVADHFLTAGH